MEYLAAGQTKVESFTITLNDGHGGIVTNSQRHHHRHQRRADHRCGADATGAVTEQVTPAGNLTSNGSIAFTDVDLTDVHRRLGDRAPSAPRSARSRR